MNFCFLKNREKHEETTKFQRNLEEKKLTDVGVEL